MNQTKEERPRKKKKVKGFDYEKSRYISKATDAGGHYVYTEDGAPIGGAVKKKGKKAKPAEDADSGDKDDSGGSASLGQTRPKPAFKKMTSFGDQNKSKGGAGGMTPEQAMQAAQAAQSQASQAQGQSGGQWNNFQTGPQSGYSQGQPGQVKVMP